MTNQGAISILSSGVMGTGLLIFLRSLGLRRISWLLILTPFLLAWFYITYGYVWMLYVWQ